LLGRSNLSNGIDLALLVHCEERQNKHVAYSALFVVQKNLFARDASKYYKKYKTGAEARAMRTMQKTSQRLTLFFI
jgi:hypothetical protein